jgi:hypothetical protein
MSLNSEGITKFNYKKESLSLKYLSSMKPVIAVPISENIQLKLSNFVSQPFSLL